jgi:hypothetical protein
MQPWILPTILAGLFMAGFAGNEATHGGFAEAMGMGHRHMLDNGGYHCVDHDDPEHGPHHMEHMHGDEPMRHEMCPGGAGMHRHNGMGGGMMGGRA